MYKFVLAIFLTLGAAFSSEVRASEYFNGHVLLAECNHFLRARDSGVAPPDSAGLMVGRCIGLVKGVIDFNTLYQAKNGGSDFFCLPSGMSYEQAIRIVVKYMRDNPSILHTGDSVIAISALERAYPCAGGR